MSYIDFFKKAEASDFYTEKINENSFKKQGNNNLIDPISLDEFNSLYKDCFSDLTNIDINDFEAHKEYSLFSIENDSIIGNRTSIAYHFLMTKYIYPNIEISHFANGFDKDSKEIQSKEVQENIFRAISQNKNIFLTGSVGDGKSTFLKRLCFDLRKEIKNLKTFPIYIDIQKEYITTYENLLSYILDKIGFNKIVRTYEHDVSKIQKIDILARIEVRASLLSLIKVHLGGKDKYSSVEKERKEVTKYQIIEDPKKIIQEFINSFREFDCKVIFLIDNLDTLNYENERFMFFDNEDGFNTFNYKGKIAKDLVNSFIKDFSNDCSCIFSLRPYVYSQIITTQEDTRQHLFDNTIKVQLMGSYPLLAIGKRAELLNDICTLLLDSQCLPEGRMKNILELLTMYNTMYYDSFKNKTQLNKVLRSFYNVATQGHRTLVSFYHDVGFYPDKYESFTSHDAIILYKLDFFKKYSQILPKKCNNRVKNNSGKKYIYPNMFLVVTDYECNKKNKTACIPNRFTYWLKYLILFFINNKENSTIKEVLDIFVNEGDEFYYDEHTVRLILGSLGTSNEDNCIKFDFNGLPENLEELERETIVNATRFGANIIESNSSFSFFDLQFFAEDYLLPKPKIEDILSEENVAYIKKHSSELNYVYLINKRENPTKMINYKCKMCRLFLYYLEYSYKHEKQKYYKVWDKLKALFTEEEIFNEDFFEVKREKIIKDAEIVLKYSKNALEDSTNFLSELEIKKINDFFSKVYSNNLKICT